jgi:pimeloyl-ACP methyl ester carboxylesterase
LVVCADWRVRARPGQEGVTTMSTQQLSRETRTGLPGSFVELSAGVTHYDIRGDDDGDVVVLIHGNAAPQVTWDRTIGPLADAGFRVLRYDLFGHGFSDRPKLPTYDRHFYNVQLAELLSRLDIPGPVRLVGSSQGGSIATCFGAENPGAVSKLALLAPFFDELPGSDGLAYRLVTAPVLGELILKVMGDRRLADLADAVVSVEAVPELQRQVAEQFRYEGKRRAVLANLRGDALEDATACYRSVRDQGVPVLLTCGTQDHKMPRECMTRLRELMPDIEYHEIGGAGHLAHYEAPDQVNPLLTRFLTG